MDVFEFAIKMNDLASNKLTKLSLTANSVFGSLNRNQTKWAEKTKVTGGLITGLDNKLKILHSSKKGATSIRQISRLNKEIRKTEKSLHKLDNLPSKAIGQRFNILSGSVKGLTTGIVGTIGVLGILSGLKSVGQLGMDLEMTRIKFDTMLGARSKANKMIADINTFANKTPYENEALQNSAIKLLNYGIVGKKIIPTIKLLGDIAGGQKDKMDRLSLAYGQINAKGKLMGQELLQLTEAGFNPLQIISKKTGETMNALYKRMSKGGIGVGEVEQALIMATSEGGRFYNMMDKLSKTGSGKLSTLVGTFKNKLAEFSEKYLIPAGSGILDFGIKVVNGLSVIKAPVLSIWGVIGGLITKIGFLIGSVFGISQSVDGATTFLNGFSTVLNVLAIGIDIVGSGLGAIISGLTFLMPILKIGTILFTAFNFQLILAKVGFWALNVAMTANPIGLVVAGLTLLIGGLVVAYKKFDTFRGILHGSWEVIKTFGVMLKEYAIDRILGLLKGVGSLGKAISFLFKGDFRKAFSESQNAMNGFLGTNARKNAFKKAKSIGENFKKGFKEGAEKTFEPSGLSKLATGVKSGSSLISSTSNSGLETSGKTPDLTKGIDNTINGGTKHNNITIHIEKFQDEFIIQTQNFENGLEDIEDKMKEMWLRVINSGNATQMG